MTTSTAAPATDRGSARTVGATPIDGPVTHWLGPLLVLVTGVFMTMLDASIINVAIPTIQTQFGGTTSDMAWISTSYSLVLGVVVPTTAWFGDRFGLGRLYTVSLVGFAVASALCGLSWSLPSLIAFRVLQAIPGGILPAITMTMLYRIVPPEKIGTAMGIYGVGVITAPALGPTLGGYLVEFVDWRVIFYINVPVAVVGVALALWMLPKFATRATYPFDVAGFVAVAGGLVPLLLAFAQGASWGWTSYPILGLFSYGVLSLAAFVIIELEVEHPLLNLRVFRNWPFLNSLLIITVQTIGMFATLFYIPVFLQSAMGLGALDAGLIALPQALVMTVMVPLSGQLYDRFGPRWLVFSGLLIAAYATWLMTGLNLSTSRGEIIWWTCLRAIGMGLGMMSVQASGLSSLDPSMTNSGTAINNVIQRISSALGLAALSAWVTVLQAQMLADRTALIPSSSAVARLGAPALSQLYQGINLEVFASAITNMFQVTTWITVAAAMLALLMRTGPATSRGGRSRGR